MSHWHRALDEFYSLLPLEKQVERSERQVKFDPNPSEIFSKTVTDLQSGRVVVVETVARVTEAAFDARSESER